MCYWMNIHLPADLMFTRAIRFWPIPISLFRSKCFKEDMANPLTWLSSRVRLRLKTGKEGCGQVHSGQSFMLELAIHWDFHWDSGFLMVILVGFDDGEMRFNVDFMGFQWDLIIVVIYGVSRIRGYIYAQRLGFAQALQRRGFPFTNKWCCKSP